MKWIVISLLFYSLDSLGSSVYDSRADTAINNAFSTTNGFFGSNPTSCLVCHTSSTGGLGTANTAFGTHFRINGSGSSGMTVSQLETVFTNIKGLDSDGDSYSNETEFQGGSNPNDSSSTPSPPSGGNGNSGGSNDTAVSPVTGGCGKLNGGDGFYYRENNGEIYYYKATVSISFLFFIFPLFILIGIRKKT